MKIAQRYLANSHPLGLITILLFADEKKELRGQTNKKVEVITLQHHYTRMIHRASLSHHA